MLLETFMPIMVFHRLLFSIDCSMHRTNKPEQTNGQKL